MRLKLKIRAGVLCSLLLPIVLAGCGQNAPETASSDFTNPEKEPAVTLDADAPAQGRKVQVLDGEDKLLFALQPSAKGFTVEDMGGRKIGSVKVEDDRVKLADGTGKARYKVKRKEDGFKLYAEPEQVGDDIELAQIKLEGGGLRVKDASEKKMLSAKTKESRLRVDTLSGERVVTNTQDGAKVEDARGRRLLRVQGANSQILAALVASDDFDVLQKAALAAYILGVRER